MTENSIKQIEVQEAAIDNKLMETRRDKERVYTEIKSCNNTLSSLNTDLKVMENNVEHAKTFSSTQIEELERANVKKELCEKEINDKHPSSAGLQGS